MPFIDSKVTLPMTEDKKETIKAKLGQAITTNAPFSNFFPPMQSVQSSSNPTIKNPSDLFNVAVSLFGNASPDAYSQMTAKICDIYETELGIPQDAVYVTYSNANSFQKRFCGCP